MPLWTEYKKHAQERGSLAFEVYVAVSTPVEGNDKFGEVLPDHLAYIQSLESDGSLMFAGPLSDETGEQMEAIGMLVFRAPTLEAARDLAANDPMHKEGVRSFTMRRWLINEGSLNLSIGLSTKSVSF